MAPIPHPKPAFNSSGSPFFNVPIEIRTAIYALVLGGPDVWNRELHLSRHNNVFQLSPCLGEDDNRMHPRSDTGKWPEPSLDPGGLATTATCARRLRSPWGPHWRCEEQMLASLEQATPPNCITGPFGPFLPMFQVCRQM